MTDADETNGNDPTPGNDDPEDDEDFVDEEDEALEAMIDKMETPADFVAFVKALSKDVEEDDDEPYYRPTHDYLDKIGSSMGVWVRHPEQYNVPDQPDWQYVAFLLKWAADNN